APWQLLLATVISGAGWAALGGAAINAIVAPWFVRARPAALSTAYNGASIGGVIFSPLWVAAIDLFGFPLATAIIGTITAVTVWLLAERVVSRTPQQMGVAPDGDVSGAHAVPVGSSLARPLPGALLWRDRQFITLAAGMALGLFAQIGLIAHLFSLLVPALGAQGAGLAIGFATASAIAGRTLVGWLMPAGADRRLVACSSYAVRIIGSVAFIAAAGKNVPLLLVGITLFGAGIGNATSLPPLIAQVEFAKEDVQRAVSLLVAIATARFALAPAAFGAMRAVELLAAPAQPGHAPLLFAGAAVVQVLAIASFWIGRRR